MKSNDVGAGRSYSCTHWWQTAFILGHTRLRNFNAVYATQYKTGIVAGNNTNNIMIGICIRLICVPRGTLIIR